MAIDTLLDVLPAGLAVFVVVGVAVFLGLFRSIALSKNSYASTVESLRTQISVIKEEKEVHRKHSEQLQARIQDYCNGCPLKK